MPSSIPPLEPYPAPPNDPEPRPFSRVDASVTSLLLVALGPCAVYAAYLGLDRWFECLAEECSTDRVNEGVFVLVTAPLGCWVGAVVVSMVLMFKHRLAFWVPILAVVVWLPLRFYGVSVSET